MYSTTKSVTSALIGIAINQGIISSITDRVLPYFTNFSPAFCGTLKSNISIEDVLTMRSGLTWNEDRDESLSWMNYDPVHFVLNKPMAAPPGTVWNYSTGSAHILTSLLARKLRTNVASWANENLFTPIAIKRFRWDKNQNYVPQGGKGLFLTSRDMAKFGWLYLNKGCWEGKQVVPTNWVEASTAKHSETPWFGDYGYLWWINKSGGFSTQGAFGQSIFVYPDKELVVVFTANLPVETASIQLENIVKSYVLTAINK